MTVDELGRRLADEGFRQVLVYAEPNCLKCGNFILEQMPDRIWIVYFVERGLDTEIGSFTDEASACKCMLETMIALKKASGEFFGSN